MTEPRIVSPEEAQGWIAHGAYGSPYVREIDRLAHTVATEEVRTRAAMARAYAEGEAAAWNRHRPEWEHKPNPYADAIENGADW